MGQIISYLCKWRYPTTYKSNYQTLAIVSQQHNNESISKPPEQHCIINISDHQNETEIQEAVHQAAEKDYYKLDDDHGNDQQIVLQDDEVALEVEVVVQNNVSTTTNTTTITNSNRIPIEISSVKRIGQYNSTQKILLVGDGDFSFSASLALAFGDSALNITATSFDSQEFLMNNYGKFLHNKAHLEARGSMVLHDVDANKMAKHPILRNYFYDRIIFNFPHAGRFTHSDSDLQKHKKLIRGFLRNAKKMIEDDGEIHITSKCNGFYLKWDIPILGSDHGLHLIQEMKFKRGKYPGYTTKYGFGGDKDFDCNPSKTYKFRL